MATEETKQNVFQTPNPTELKAAAKAAPIQEREPASDETAAPIVDSDEALVVRQDRFEGNLKSTKPISWVF
jgi:hypothetical protein